MRDRVMLALIVACVPLEFGAAGEPAPQPNILLIIGDDQGWTDYGFMGSRHVLTPHLDKLAGESLVFPRGYVPSSLCRPSLATMVTGLFPHQHLVMTNDPPDPPNLPRAAWMKSERYLNDRAAMVARFQQSPNLAKLLSRKGYISHQSGKWWEGDACRCGGFTQGMTHGDPAKGGRHGDNGLTIGREGLEAVFGFLDQAKRESKPFFVWYAPMMPHAPHNPPSRLLKKYVEKTRSIHLARSWAMCEWFDETVGELLARLEKNGQSENTIVVYLHDNGWIQDPNSAAYAPKSKQSPYDGGLRTPILLRWPTRVKPGTSSALASSIDLTPTLLHAVGLQPTPDMQGLNLLDAAALAQRDCVFGEVFFHTAIELEKPKSNLRYRWVIHRDWKLIVPDAENLPAERVHLYDLANDPHETTNRAGIHPDRVFALAKTLDAWWKP